MSTRRMGVLLLLIMLSSFSSAWYTHHRSTVHATMTDAAIAQMISTDFTFAASQLNKTAAPLSTTAYPYTASTTSWTTTGASSWTSGFFPGSLWLMYNHTHDASWQAKAQQWQSGIESQKTNTGTHDVGFMMMTSFGNGYRFTGNAAWQQVLLTAAGSLATRYNSTVGAIRSRNNGTGTDFEVIIDNMMNLELLYWGAAHGGNPAWKDMATSHALKTMQNHIRADGSTYHVVYYDSSTGAVKRQEAGQGYSTTSTWSRGEAWAVYGFTTSYRETGDQRFLDTARKAADYFISHLPSDHIPYWDFQAPGIPNEPRDTSAAAIAASGILELSRLETDTTRKQTYYQAGLDMLSALSSPAYLASSTNPSILLHGTQNKPGGNADTGLTFGDYYFLQALSQLPAVASPTPTLPADSPTPNPPTPSSPAIGSPTAGPTPNTACPKKSQGDADCDGIIKLADYAAWRSEFFGEVTTKLADFNGDGKVTLKDHSLWRQTFFDINGGLTPTPTSSPPPTTPPSPSPAGATPTAPVPTPTHGATGCTYPAQILNLTNWYEGLPIGSGSSPTNITQPQLATYTIDPWFKVNSTCNGVQFRAAVNGVTTSGSSYPRSELREESGANHAAWSNTSGTHTMIIDQAITHLPQTKNHVVAGQIHDANNDITVIRLEGTTLYSTLGNNTHAQVIDSNYALGTRFQIKFVAANGKIDVYYQKAGATTFTLVHSITQSISNSYFKAGAYTQSNCSTEASGACTDTNYGEVVIYNLQVMHQ